MVAMNRCVAVLRQAAPIKVFDHLHSMCFNFFLCWCLWICETCVHFCCHVLGLSLTIAVVCCDRMYVYIVPDCESKQLWWAKGTPLYTQEITAIAA